MMKAAKTRTLADLKSRSFLSHKAFMKNPQARKPTHARKSGTNCCVSLRYNPIKIGTVVNTPAICSKKPKFAKMRLRIAIHHFLVSRLAKKLVEFQSLQIYSKQTNQQGLIYRKA
jgi:hypothetical protein